MQQSLPIFSALCFLHWDLSSVILLAVIAHSLHATWSPKSFYRVWANPRLKTSCYSSYTGCILIQTTSMFKLLAASNASLKTGHLIPLFLMQDPWGLKHEPLIKQRPAADGPSQDHSSLHILLGKEPQLWQHYHDRSQHNKPDGLKKQQSKTFFALFDRQFHTEAERQDCSLKRPNANHVGLTFMHTPLHLKSATQLAQPSQSLVSLSPLWGSEPGLQILLSHTKIFLQLNQCYTSVFCCFATHLHLC